MKRTATLLLCGAAVLAAAPARAQDLGDLEGLLNESVVSTASKSAERASSAPAQIINITSDELRVFGMRTVGEALSFLGVGVYVAHTAETIQYPGVTSETGARGLMFRDGGSRILVLIDGHTTNSQIDGRSWLDDTLGMPMEMIDHIEIMLGPGSVMYGSNAFFGVVNVISKRARDLPGISGSASVSLQPPQGDDRNLTTVGHGDSLGATYRFSLGLAREFKLFGRPAEVTAQAQWQFGNSGSYRVGPQYGSYELGVFSSGGGAWRGTVSNSLNAPALVAALRVGDWRLALQASTLTRSAPLIGTLGASGNNDSITHVGLDLRNSTNLGSHVTLSSRLYADATEQKQNQQIPICGPEFPTGCTIWERRVSQWLGLEEQAVADWKLDGRLTTTLGFDVRVRRSQALLESMRDPLTLAAAQTGQSPYIDSVDVLGGIYLQQVYQPLSWLTLNAGLRVDFDELFGAHASPRAAVVFRPAKGNTIKLMYAEAFRAPTPLEVQGTDWVDRIRPTKLLPEVVRSVELEVSQRWSSGSVALNGFLSYYDDMIGNRTPTSDEYQHAIGTGEILALIPASGFQVLDNLGQMRSYGGSARVDQRLPRGWSGGLGLLVSKVELSSETGIVEAISLTPSWFGNAHLMWQPRPDGFALGFATIVSGSRTPYLASYTPAAPIVQGPSADLRLTATLPIAGIKGLAMRLIADYNTDGRAPIQVGGAATTPAATQAEVPMARSELVPLPRAFFMAEVRYEH
jgi:outer membrane receptor for ferrienterochelin and colicins